MYQTYFGLTEAPFSIAPDPRYLYLSQRHQEALAHLLYGVNSGGGFVLLTGEIGAGKTTVCRCLLEQIPDTCDVAYIFNPKLTVGELLSTICIEFGVSYPADTTSVKVFVDRINTHLLDAHARGRHTVLIIDEAQNLAPAVLEQLRLLTNLETSQRKLLQIILLGQPELATMLEQPGLRQLAQRIVARYHLGPLTRSEVAAYVRHRLEVSGTQRPLFPARLLRHLYRLSGGIPRVINVLCDRALLGTYVQGKDRVNDATLTQAAREVFGTAPRLGKVRPLLLALLLVSSTALALRVVQDNLNAADSVTPQPVAKKHVMPKKPVSQSLPAATLPAIMEWPEGESRLLSKKIAYGVLFRAWGVDYQGGDVCRQAEGLGFHCQAARGGLDELRQFNRPAVLQMRDDHGQDYRAALTALDATSATFTFGSHTEKVAIGALARQWTGYYTLLWRMAADTPRNIRKGDQGPDVEWLRKHLALVQEGVAAHNGDTMLDDALVEQIKLFQFSQGLVPDGTLGSRTILRLSSESDRGAPRLFTAQPGR